MNKNIRIREAGTGLSIQAWEYSGLLQDLSNEQKEEIVPLLNDAINVITFDVDSDLDTTFIPLVRRIYSRGVLLNVKSAYKAYKAFRKDVKESSEIQLKIDSNELEISIIVVFVREYLEGEFNAAIQ